MSNILKNISDACVEKGEEIIEDLLNQIKQNKLATLTNTYNWPRVNVKATIYFTNGNKIQIDNLETDRPIDDHPFLKKIEKVSYNIFINLEFLPQFNDLSSGYNHITDTDMDEFKKVVNEWVNEWKLTILSVTKHNKNNIIYVFAHDDIKTIDMGKIMKKINERKYIDTLSTFKTNLLESSNEEIWKNVPYQGYEKYMVSNLGRIKNPKGEIMQMYEKKIGNKIIVMVSLSGKSKKRNFIVSHLVAKAFINGKGSVIHIDGDKRNNKASNLKYVSNPSKYSNKFFERPSGEKAHDSFKINQYDLNGNLVRSYGSIRDASKETGIPTTNISKVAKGKRNTAGGYIWEYDKDKSDYRGVDPEIIKDMRDYYSMNNVTIGDVWRKFKITSDQYGTSRIIRGLVYKTDEYLPDRAKEIINSIDYKDIDDLKNIMKDKYRYYITDTMLDN